jgi:hypothetical protein
MLGPGGAKKRAAAGFLVKLASPELKDWPLGPRHPDWTPDKGRAAESSIADERVTVWRSIAP